MSTLAQLLNAQAAFVSAREAFEENSTSWAHDLAMGFRVTESDQKIRERMVLAFTLVDAVAPDDPEIRPFIEQIRAILPNETAYIDRGISANVLRDLMIGGTPALEQAALAVLREPRGPQSNVSAKMRLAIVSSSDSGIHGALRAMKQASPTPASVTQFMNVLSSMRSDLADLLNSATPSGRWYNGPEIAYTGAPRDLVAGGSRPGAQPVPGPTPSPGGGAAPAPAPPSSGGGFQLDPIALPGAGTGMPADANADGVLDSIEVAIEYAEAVAQIAGILGCSLVDAGRILMLIASYMRILIGRPLPAPGVAGVIDTDMSRLERLVDRSVELAGRNFSNGYELPDEQVRSRGAVQRLVGRRA